MPALSPQEHDADVKTYIITLPERYGKAVQLLIRDNGGLADIRENYGVWTPIELTGGTVEVAD